MNSATRTIPGSGRLQSPLCHSERSEESSPRSQGFLAALRMTGAHDSYFAIVLSRGKGLSKVLWRWHCRVEKPIGTRLAKAMSTSSYVGMKVLGTTLEGPPKPVGEPGSISVAELKITRGRPTRKGRRNRWPPAPMRRGDTLGVELSLHGHAVTSVIGRLEG